MNPAIIPSIDPIPLPAPIWLMRVLSGLTFVLHVIPMNIVLAGGLMAALLMYIGRRTEQEHYQRLAGEIAHILPSATALAITMGVPPLLFLQALYGPLFYTSSILMAVPWISVIALLLIGYYGYYWFALHRGRTGKPSVVVGLVASILFLCIGFIYTNNMTLMIDPGKFAEMYRQHAYGFMLNTSDPQVVPRYLHFFVGAVAVTSLLVMFVGVARRKESDYSEAAIRFGGLGFVFATLVQFCIGIWLLLAIRRPVMMLFMGGDTAATVIFGIAFFLALVAMILVLMAALGKSPVGLSIAGGCCILVTITLMTIMRAILRDAYLGKEFVVTNQPVVPNWPVIGIFFVLLIAGVWVVAWMTHAVVTRRGMPARA